MTYASGALMTTRRTTAWEGIAFDPIEAAELQEGSSHSGVPVSSKYDDVYFNAVDGCAETEYVFLQQNELERRFRALSDGSGSFTIGELGFGTALSFLSVAHLWSALAPPDAHLHFVSFEKYPIAPEQLEKIHEHWPAFAMMAAELRKNLPECTPGFHRRCFSDPRISLTLAYGDARDLLPLVRGQVDAWFLDGFSPAKNPELWSEAIGQEVARCSRPGATFSTFSAAGHVRRSLEASGFRVEKAKGFGNKRELLKGVYQGEQEKEAEVRGRLRKKRVCIIGAGLAGVMSARSLLRRGYEVTIIEKQSDICQGASGNPSATLMPPVYSQFHALHRFYSAGFQFTRSHILSLAEQTQEDIVRGTAVIKVPGTRQEIKLMASLPRKDMPESIVRAMTAEEASQLLGFRPREDVLFFPNALCYQPYAYCRAVLNQLGEGLRLVFDTEVSALERSADVWKLYGEGKEVLAEAEYVVLANAFSCEHIKQTSWMRLEKVRGQIASLPTSLLPASPRVGFFDKVYLLPDSSETSVLGATWDHDDMREDTDQEQQQNLLSDLAVAMGAELKEALSHVEGRVSFRSSTPDRMPYVGPLWSKDREQNQGLFVSIGHGSRGGASCGISAEILAAYIDDEIFPCDSDVLRTLDPRRESAFKPER